MSSSAPPLAPGSALGTFDLWAFARRMLWACVIVELVLVVGDVFFNLKEVWTNDVLEDMWNMGAEDSLTTWFSGVQLFFVAVVAWMCARLSRVRGLGKDRRIGWIVAAVFFAYLSADEVAQIHEGMGSAAANAAREARVEAHTEALVAGGMDPDDAAAAAEEAIPDEGEGPEAGHETYGWQIYVLPFYLLVALLVTAFVGPTLWREGLFGWYVAGGLLYLVAQGLDRFEGMWWFEDEAKALAERIGWRKYDLTHPLIMAEELCEMLGVTLLCQAFLRHLASLGDGLGLKLVARKA